MKEQEKYEIIKKLVETSGNKDNAVLLDIISAPVIYEKKILAMGRPTAKTAIRLIMLIRIPYL